MGEMITIQAGQDIRAYVAKPSGPAKAAVIVIHEVWGMVEHTTSVADRLAAEGYIALAPDLITDTIEAAGVDTSKLQDLQEALFDPKRRNQVQPELRKIMTPIQNPEFGEQTLAGLKASFDYLYELPESQQKVAVMGFCFGGTYSFSLATQEPRLMAAIPFYGHSDADADTLRQIRCPVLAFYGEKDENLIAGLDDLKQRMSAAEVDFTAKVYPDCGHAFFNDTNPYAYNQAAATDAWNLVMSFLRKTVD